MKNKQFALRFILITLIFALSGCASRKVDRKEEKQKIDFTEKTSEETKVDSQTTTKVIDTSTIDEIEIVPIDSTKPVVINGKTYLNAKIKHVKRKNNITTDKVEKVAKNQHKQAKRELKAETSSKEKETERKSGFSWWWILLAIPIYIVYRKYLR
jgi:preprotein translocase subunit SecF